MAVTLRQGVHHAVRSLQAMVAPLKGLAPQSFLWRECQGKGQQERHSRQMTAQESRHRQGRVASKVTRCIRRSRAREDQHRLSRAGARMVWRAQKGLLRTLQARKRLMFTQRFRPSRSVAVRACNFCTGHEASREHASAWLQCSAACLHTAAFHHAYLHASQSCSFCTIAQA